MLLEDISIQPGVGSRYLYVARGSFHIIPALKHTNNVQDDFKYTWISYIQSSEIRLKDTGNVFALKILQITETTVSNFQNTVAQNFGKMFVYVINLKRFWQIYTGLHLSSLGRIFRCVQYIGI